MAFDVESWLPLGQYLAVIFKLGISVGGGATMVKNFCNRVDFDFGLTGGIIRTDALRHRISSTAGNDFFSGGKFFFGIAPKLWRPEKRRWPNRYFWNIHQRLNRSKALLLIRSVTNSEQHRMKMKEVITLLKSLLFYSLSSRGAMVMWWELGQGNGYFQISDLS